MWKQPSFRDSRAKRFEPSEFNILNAPKFPIRVIGWYRQAAPGRLIHARLELDALSLQVVVIGGKSRVGLELRPEPLGRLFPGPRATPPPPGELPGGGDRQKLPLTNNDC